MVTANAKDTLYEVLRKLRDKNVSMIIVERKTLVRVGPQATWTETVETVGIVFLSDLMFLLRQLNFHDILTQPVINFCMNLNGTEEDRRAFKERNYKLSQISHGEGLPFNDAVSYHTSQHAGSKAPSNKPE